MIKLEEVLNSRVRFPQWPLEKIKELCRFSQDATSHNVLSLSRHTAADVLGLWRGQLHCTMAYPSLLLTSWGCGGAICALISVTFNEQVAIFHTLPGGCCHHTF